jgi:hypothetical protein
LSINRCIQEYIQAVGPVFDEPRGFINSFCRDAKYSSSNLHTALEQSYGQMSLMDAGENPDQVYVAVTATNMKGDLKLQRSYSITTYENKEYEHQKGHGTETANHILHIKPDEILLWRAYVPHPIS